MGNRDVVKEGVCSVSDGLYLYDLALPLAQAVTCELAKGPFRRAFRWEDLGLDDYFCVGRDQYLRGLALHQLERLSQKGPHDCPLVFVNGTNGESPKCNCWVHSNGEGHG